MSFFAEIRRRKVFQVAAVYAVVSWLIIQIVDVVGEPLNLPGWLDTVVIILLAVGFPIAVILAWAFDLTPQGVRSDAGAQIAGAAPRLPGQELTFGIQILVLLAVGVLVADQYLLEPRGGATASSPASPSEAARFVDRFDYVLPKDRAFRSMNRRVIALSLDGRNLVYNATDGFYLRRMDELEAHLIPGTQAGESAAIRRASSPTFSPDGLAIAYSDTTSRQLMRVALNGGPPVRISDVGPEPASVTWEQDGTIFYQGPDGFYRISAEGATAELVVSATEGMNVYGPSLLPDGVTLLFSMAPRGAPDAAQVVAQTLTTGDRTVLIDGRAPRYLPTGHLIYARGDTLFGIAFDPEELTTSGLAVPLVQGVMGLGGVFAGAGGADQLAQFDVAEDGTLAYVAAAAAESRRTLVWVDRQGREQAIPIPVGGYVYPRISPDGTRIALDDRDANNSIWVWNIRGETLTRLATGDLGGQYPVWSTDGSRIAFQPIETQNLESRAANNTGETQRLATNVRGARAGLNVHPYFFTPSGRELVFRNANRPYTADDIGMVAIDNVSEPVWLLEGPHEERNAELSPDGRWMAYQSDESGRFEIIVSPFPNVDDNRFPISNAGGERPLWSRDGSELFYLEPGPPTRLISVAVDTGGAEFSFSTRNAIFDPWPYRGLGTPAGRPYDISLDGERFLAIKEVDVEGATPRIIVVQNWFEEVLRRVPTE